MKKQWRGHWYNPDLTPFSTFSGTSVNDPVTAAWKHYNDIKNQIQNNWDSSGAACTDSNLLLMEKLFHPDSAIEITAPLTDDNQTAMGIRGVVRTHSNSVGHLASHLAIAQLARTGAKDFIVASLPKDNTFKLPIDPKTYWNGTALNPIMTPEEGVKRMEEDNNFGLHPDCWDHFKNGRQVAKFSLMEMAKALKLVQNGTNTFAGSKKFETVSYSTLTRLRNDMQKEEPIPRTIDDIGIFVAKKHPTVDRNGCSDAVKALPTYFSFNNTSRQKKAKEDDNETLQKRILDLDSENDDWTKKTKADEKNADDNKILRQMIADLEKDKEMIQKSKVEDNKALQKKISDLEKDKEMIQKSKVNDNKAFRKQIEALETASDFNKKSNASAYKILRKRIAELESEKENYKKVKDPKRRRMVLSDVVFNSDTD